MKKTNKIYKNLLVKTDKEKKPQSILFSCYFGETVIAFLGGFGVGKRKGVFIYLFNCQGAEHSSFYIAFKKYLLN